MDCWQQVNAVWLIAKDTPQIFAKHLRRGFENGVEAPLDARVSCVEHVGTRWFHLVQRVPLELRLPSGLEGAIVAST